MPTAMNVFTNGKMMTESIGYTIFRNDFLRLANLACRSSSLSRSLLALYCSLRRLSLSSLSLSPSICYHAEDTISNLLETLDWRISNLHSPLFLQWFTLRTIFGIPVNYVVNCPLHGLPYEPYVEDQ